MPDRRPSGHPRGPSDGSNTRPSGTGIDPDAPPSAEEVAASARMRDDLEGTSLEGAEQNDDLELARSLRAAWSPSPLDERAHAAILDEMPSSAEEIGLAAELRDALEGKGNAPDVVTAVRSAWSPTTLEDSAHRSMVEKALGAGAVDGRSNVVHLESRARTVRLTVVTTTVLALAASVVVWVTSAPSQVETPLAKARSTQPLFDEPFKAGEASARIDRIASARASDYRDNRFATWGVR